MRKSNVLVYSLDNKVVFPYTEFQTSIVFEDFICNFESIQLKGMTI